MGVRRCVCSDVTFEQLKGLAATVGHDFEAIERHTGAGRSCGTCVPYILRMLETGETNLPILSEDECLRLLARQEARRASA